MKKKLRKSFSILAVFVLMMVSAIPVNASGKTMTAVKSKSNAPKLSMNKSYTVRSKKKGNSCVKFVAPATGSYQFMVSNLARYGYSSESSKSEIQGFIMFDQKGGPSLLHIQTQGGKNFRMRLQSAYRLQLYPKSGNPNRSTSYLLSRYAILKIKKGKTIYLRNYFCNIPYSYNIKIIKYQKEKEET